MRRPSNELALLILLGAGARSSAAQSRLVYFPLDSATVVRLHLFRGGTVSGELLQPFASDSSQFVTCAARPNRCRWNLSRYRRVTDTIDVRRVDLRRGGRTAQGALVGMGVLLGGSAAFCALTDTGGCDPAKGGYFSYVALPSALVGAALGALVGARVPKREPAP